MTLLRLLFAGRMLHSRDLDGLSEALVDCPDVMAPPRYRPGDAGLGCDMETAPADSAEARLMGDSQAARSVA